MSPSIYEQHLQTQQEELQRRYGTLTKRITALDADIGRELDSERKSVLEERRDGHVQEREKIAQSLYEVTQQLAQGRPGESISQRPGANGENGKEKRQQVDDPCAPVAKPPDDIFYPYRHDSATDLWGLMQEKRRALAGSRTLVSGLEAAQQQARLSNPLAAPMIDRQLAQLRDEVAKTETELDAQAQVLAWMLYRDCQKQQALQGELAALQSKPQRDLTDPCRLSEIKKELAAIENLAAEARPYLREL